MISNLKNLVYNLDKFNNSYYNTVKLKQNDIRTLEIHVYENGEELDLAGYTAVVKWVNANNTVAPLTTSNIEIKDNTIYVKMAADCTRSAGVAKWELVLSKNDSIDYSFTQEIKILSSVEQGQEESKNVSTLLEDVTKAQEEATKFVNTYGNLGGLKDKVDKLNNTKANDTDLQAVKSSIANIIAHNNDTNGNSELIDMRIGADGNTYKSAGEASRSQIGNIFKSIDNSIILSNLFEQKQFIIKAGDSFTVETLDKSVFTPTQISLFDENDNKIDYFSLAPTGLSKKTITYNNDKVVHSVYINGGTAQAIKISINNKHLGELSLEHDKNIHELKRLTPYSIAAFTTGSRPQISVAPNGSGIKVKVPNKLVFFGYKNYPFDVNFDSEQEFNLNHNQVLYYDFEEQALKTCDYSALKKITNTISVLAYANDGRCISQWERYYLYNDVLDKKQELQKKSYKSFSTEFSSRQGEIGGHIENTLKGAKYAKEHGYDRCRMSVQFSKDGIPVLLHDYKLGAALKVYDSTNTSITGNAVNTYTLEELKQYHYGNATNELVTLEEFIAQCKKIGQKADLEFKDTPNPTQSNMQTAYDIVCKYGMIQSTCFMGYSTTVLSYIKSINPSCNFGLIGLPVTKALLDSAKTLLTGQNEVYFCLYASDFASFTDEIHQYGLTNGIKFKMGSALNIADIKKFSACELIECANVEYPDWELAQEG